MSTDQRLAAHIDRARQLVALGKCPDHGGNAIHCGDCAADRLVAGDHAAIRNHAAVRAMAACDRLFPLRYRDARTDHPDVAGWIQTVVDDPAGGASLLLAGPVGRGKTWQAYGAVRTIAAALPGLDWAVTAFADFAASLRPRPGIDSEAEMERYRGAGLLLLDDIGAAKWSEWTEEITYRLVSHRYDAMRPTIYVTNLGAQQLATAVGDRIASRLAETCQRVVLDGPDRRRSAS